MLNIFVDTDIILDFLGDRKPFAKYAVQHYCALTIDNIECIITRNLKDYKKSRIPVIGPEQLSI